jgi:hypothetical protein
LNKVALGTSLTALFLLVRCSVPERDYSRLGIGDNAGSGGGSGSGGDGTGGTSAGVGGMGDVGGQGGQAGSSPVEPVPCVEVDEDAGTTDTGITDAGIDAGASDAGTDAGSDDEPCACVDGFVRAVDADGDGEGTLACSVAPGLDCDDDDAAVTHNGCGGCTALPNAIGEDCLDCGAYICDGPDALTCGAKPDPVEDPDCRCVAGLITASDADGDGQGTRLCQVNPGTDCNDADNAFATNACGGCESLPGSVGGPCNVCGVYACNGTGLACVPSSGAAGRRCLDATTPQTCVGDGFWDTGASCANVCYQGNCEICTPGTFQCVDLGEGSTQVQVCGTLYDSVGSAIGIGWGSYASCVPGETCNPGNGTCTSYLMWPRDQTFDVVPRLERGGLRWHDVLNTASDSDYG